VGIIYPGRRLSRFDRHGFAVCRDRRVTKIAVEDSGFFPERSTLVLFVPTGIPWVPLVSREKKVFMAGLPQALMDMRYP